jgi:hypothetical protein
VGTLATSIPSAMMRASCFDSPLSLVWVSEFLVGAYCVHEIRSRESVSVPICPRQCRFRNRANGMASIAHSAIAPMIKIIWSI